ncbi:32173_t:CDS:2 [Gigaspora margarita]|uniref:32173_t:CDS:1 n=1 Tax=Gigaspora margarita TaxID=4874 RepID=A0ABN7ULN1_GIGMA|nr:32173_t:CDS:2 [Gigaspora margarita]
MDIDWDSFITIPDIFNNTDLLSLSDDNDININLCPSSSNYNDYDTIVNTNLLPLEYDQKFLLLSKDDDDFNIKQKKHLIPEDLYNDTIDSNFIEDITDELQATLKAILSNTDMLNIIEIWRVRRIGGLSRRDNLVMLYSSIARFHISIIPIRWYKDDIIAKLDQVLKNSLSLSAIESSTDTIVENFGANNNSNKIVNSEAQNENDYFSKIKADFTPHLEANKITELTTWLQLGHSARESWVEDLS